MTPIPSVEVAIPQAEAALARVRATSEDIRVEEVAALVERAAGLANFDIRFVEGGPTHAIDFGGAVPQEPQRPAYPALAAVRDSVEEEIGVLIDALEDLQIALVFQADCAEFTDARFNSEQFLRAAGHVDVAAGVLGEMISDPAAGTAPPSSRPTPDPG